MPYAVIDLTNGNKVLMVVAQKWQPLMIAEEDWNEAFDEPPQPPAGYPQNFQEIFLTENEALKIAAALENGKAVRIGRHGYVDIGEGEEQESFQLREFAIETAFMGAVLDHLLFVGGDISGKHFRECQSFRKKQIDEAMAK